jgi:hypothetical protein
MNGRKQSAIMLSTNGNIKNKSDWDNQFEWFSDTLYSFTNFFKPIIKKL